MRPKIELVKSDPQTSLACFRRVEKEFPFAWHRHPELELVLIEAGSGSRFVGDHIGHYKAGDLVLLGPDLSQTWQSETPGADGLSRATVVQFGLGGALGHWLLHAPEMTQVRKLLERAKRGLFFPMNRGLKPVLAQISAMPDLSPVAKVGALCEVLDTLASRPAEPLATGEVAVLDKRAAGRLDQVLSHVQAHLGGDIQMAVVARLANMTTPAFCRFFKRATGRTFSEHLNELRLGKAARLLVETDFPVANVAAQTGYANASYFFRRFRAKYGVSALQYRKRHG